MSCLTCQQIMSEATRNRAAGNYYNVPPPPPSVDIDFGFHFSHMHYKVDKTSSMSIFILQITMCDVSFRTSVRLSC